MRKATRPVAGVSKATVTKAQTVEKVKPEGATTTMGTAGKNTAKTSATAPLSKVQMQKAKVSTGFILQRQPWKPLLSL